MKKSAVLITMLCVPSLVAGCVNKTHPVTTATENLIYNAMGTGLLGDSISQIPSNQRSRALEAEYKALEYTRSGNTINWATNDGAASGTVTPGQPYRVGSQNCRQYSHSFTIRGVPQTNRGSACRNDDGSWSPLN
ncbi:hypothetical protein N5853_06665 [Bartonella sp. HY329]|uniref:hypothetical protein n=1 Tax=unclassified Bartonella TaxID=2645622 RepID=UPI0021C947D8|nr:MULTISPECIES: hypothetical protein [unclassified Bartonella]UXM96283.1 hypothetical protein N5853_06665 [Bartonella sp. HY329]UXN10607.1 hypothetical protein N5852_06675 [Bartonella sp. HY328]